MTILTLEEQHIAVRAKADCLSYRIAAEDVPADELQRSVQELVALYHRKPSARVFEAASDDPTTLRDVVLYCTRQLIEAEPALYTLLSDALGPA